MTADGEKVTLKRALQGVATLLSGEWAKSRSKDCVCRIDSRGACPACSLRVTLLREVRELVAFTEEERTYFGAFRDDAAAQVWHDAVADAQRLAARLRPSDADLR